MIKIKFSYIIKSSIVMMYSRKKDVIMSILILFVTFFVIGYATLTLIPVVSAYKLASNTVSTSISNIYTLNLYNLYYSDNVNDAINFIDSLTNDDSILASGTYFYSSEEDNDFLVISSSLLSVIDATDVNGNKLNFSDNEETYSAIVGYDLKDKYPIGSVIVASIGENSKRYTVTQILEKNCRWFSDGNDNTFVNLDDKIIISYDNILKDSPLIALNGLSNECVITNKTTDSETLISKIKKKADEENIIIYDIKSLKERYNINLSDVTKEPNLVIMPVLLIILSAIAITISSLINIYIRKKSIGALYLSGYLKNEIILMYFIENLIPALVSAVVSISYWQMQQWNFYDINSISYMKYVTVSMLIMAVIIAFVCSLIPIFRLNHLTISEIIE